MCILNWAIFSFRIDGTVMSFKQAESLVHRLRTECASCFFDVCYAYAGKLLHISDRTHLVELLGDSPPTNGFVDSTSIGVFRNGKHRRGLCECYEKKIVDHLL
jgi:hypothetical protein